MTGTVYLIGAGPGDPGLITVKGLDLLRRADVVLYDRLIPHELLAETRPGAELIDVGKVPGTHKRDQRAINALLIEKAQRTETVVRLKGGDPFVFGRGGEEAEACRAAGVPFVVVPGVSSAVAVPAYAGIPVTHRNYNATFTVFSGHEDPTNDDSTVDYEAVARAACTGTVVLLMGIMYLPKIVAQLIAAGADPNLPAACIERGTMDGQRVVQGTLSDLPGLVHAAAIRAPATTVIGSVVRLRDALNWFEGEARVG